MERIHSYSFRQLTSLHSSISSLLSAPSCLAGLRRSWTVERRTEGSEERGRMAGWREKLKKKRKRGRRKAIAHSADLWTNISTRAGRRFEFTSKRLERRCERRPKRKAGIGGGGDTKERSDGGIKEGRREWDGGIKEGWVGRRWREPDEERSN